MPISTLHPYWVHKMHSAFLGWGEEKKRCQNYFHLYFSRKDLHLTEPGWPCSQPHAAQRRHGRRSHQGCSRREPGLHFQDLFQLRSSTGGGEGGLILPSPPWSCVPDERSRGAAVGSPPPVLRNQRRRACFKFPPALTERPPLSRVGSGWVPIAPAWVYSCTEKRFVSYLYINHKKNQRYK